MKVWLLSHGEMLPIEAGHRPMRTGMLAAELARRNHHVTWWTSTFSHRQRRLLANCDMNVRVDDRLELSMIHAGRYESTVSFARHRHNIRVGRRFRTASASRPRPDVILASYPIIELAAAAMQYGQRHGIPVVVDVRDYWPDLYVERLPRFCRGLARLALTPTFARARRTLSRANALMGISNGILEFALMHAGRNRREADRVFPIGCRTGACFGSKPAESPPFLRVASGELVCTFVGTFGSSYDLDTVLRAAARLQASGNAAVRIVIIGAGDKSAAISRVAATLPNVTLTGWLSGDDVERALADSDVGLMPLISRPDSMPNKFFEYLRAGLPIVSSLQGEVEHLMRERGLGRSYRTGDDAGLARVLADMAAARNETTSMGRRCRQLFEERYAAESIYPTYADHLESLVVGTKHLTRGATAA
jgi:glycosyltransferase involved in cell wall biosynthesis